MLAAAEEREIQAPLGGQRGAGGADDSGSTDEENFHRTLFVAGIRHFFLPGTANPPCEEVTPKSAVEPMTGYAISRAVSDSFLCGADFRWSAPCTSQIPSNLTK